MSFFYFSMILTFIQFNKRVKIASWFLYSMVTQNILRTHERKIRLLEKNIRFVTALDLSKCLKPINKRDYFLPVHLILSYHLIKVTWYSMEVKYRVFINNFSCGRLSTNPFHMSISSPSYYLMSFYVLFILYLLHN